MRIRVIYCQSLDARSGVPTLKEPHREPDELSAFGTQPEDLHADRIRVSSFPPSPGSATGENHS